MNFSLQNILDITGGKMQAVFDTDIIVRRVLTDSRQIILPSQSIFIALHGEQYDGHDYLGDAAAAGVKYALISDETKAETVPDFSCILVEDTILALQQIAAAHRAKFTYPVIGITGSNGKTVVKEWLFQLLREDYRIVRSPKSYNSQIGVPLSVLEMTEEDNLAIFEAGISQPGEMEKLAAVIQPTIGILTNIGAAHDEGFEDWEEKLQEKMRLFTEAKTIICSCHNAEFYGRNPAKCLTWGKARYSDLHIYMQRKKGNELRLLGKFNDEKTEITLTDSNEAMIENAMTCWLTLLHLGIDRKIITQRLQKPEPLPMRLELKKGGGGSLLVNDAYNSDFTSLRIALRFLEQQSKDLPRTVILSDILQSGVPGKTLYRELAILLKKYDIGKLIGIGEEIRIAANYLPEKTVGKFYPNTADFLTEMRPADFAGQAILLKGARPFTFEKIARRLEQKSHNTVLEVNLNALLHNLRVYRSYLQPETKLLVMVKASAYGSGSIETAKLLEYQRVDYFGVAYADEGVELRKGGIKIPILVLNPEPATFPQLLDYNLEPEIYKLSQLRELDSFLQNTEQQTGIHLKLETGMNRLGFSEAELPAALEILQNSDRIQVLSAFSHLVGSENPEHDAFSVAQAAQFHKSYNLLTAALGYRPFRHILNSSGISRFPAYHFNMVRLGIGIYGTDGNAAIAKQLRVVNTLKAVISQTKNLHPGDTVGYGRAGKVSTPTRTATIGIGYADGLLRAAGKGNFSVGLHGKRAPIIGNVCMDMCMIDVTHIPQAQAGDEVIIFGADPTAAELAAALGTIVYEVFTNVSERVTRVYVEE